MHFLQAQFSVLSSYQCLQRSPHLLHSLVFAALSSSLALSVHSSYQFLQLSHPLHSLFTPPTSVYSALLIPSTLCSSGFWSSAVALLVSIIACIELLLSCAAVLSWFQDSVVKTIPYSKTKANLHKCATVTHGQGALLYRFKRSNHILYLIIFT